MSKREKIISISILIFSLILLSYGIILNINVSKKDNKDNGNKGGNEKSMKSYKFKLVPFEVLWENNVTDGKKVWFYVKHWEPYNSDEAREGLFKFRCRYDNGSIGDEYVYLYQYSNHIQYLREFTTTVDNFVRCEYHPFRRSYELFYTKKNIPFEDLKEKYYVEMDVEVDRVDRVISISFSKELRYPTTLTSPEMTKYIVSDKINIGEIGERKIEF